MVGNRSAGVLGRVNDQVAEVLADGSNFMVGHSQWRLVAEK